MLDILNLFKYVITIDYINPFRTSVGFTPKFADIKTMSDTFGNPCNIKIKQEVLGRTNRLLSFDTTWIA
jgi:hypothetical protein